MSIKSSIKRLVFGPPGVRTRRIRCGLLRGAKFDVDAGAHSMRLLGLDERELAGWTRRFTKRSVLAVDVGANDGWYTTYFALQPQIERVYAFEPDQRLHDQLQRNLALNGDNLRSKVAFSAKFVGAVDDDGTCTLDTVLSKEGGSAVIKIDVEGAELIVLRATERALRRLDCHLLIETHSMQMEIECQKFLQATGYRTKVVKAGWYRLFVPEQRSLEHNRWLVASKSAL